MRWVVGLPRVARSPNTNWSDKCLIRIETRSRPSARRRTSFGSAKGAPKDRLKTIGGRAVIQRSREECHRDDEPEEEEKVLARRPDANMPALLTKDVRGG